MIIERDGMLIYDRTAKNDFSTTKESIDRMAERMIKERMRKMSNERIEELERSERVLKDLLKRYKDELPPDFILFYKRELQTISDHIEWINKELNE